MVRISCSRQPWGIRLATLGLALSACGPDLLPVKDVPQDLAAAWNPDGQRLALQHEGLDATPGIYLTRVDAAERRLLVPGGVDPDWSPDGTQLVVSTGSQIVRVVVSTGEATPISNPDALSNFPSWSPDGRSIAFSSNGGDSQAPQDLWLASGTSNIPPHRVPLAGPPGRGMFEKDWSPSSDRLVIAVAVTPLRLLVTDTSGIDTAYITPTDADARMPAWHPHGDWIAYVRVHGNYGDLWLVRPDGTENHLLIPRAAYPSWSPDGQRLAFSRPSDSSTAIWSINSDGSNPQQMTFP